MQTCPKCKTQYEDERTACPACGAQSAFLPAEGLSAFLAELRKEKEALARQKTEQSAQISFDLSEAAESATVKPAKKVVTEATRPWRMVLIVLLAAAAIACCFTPVVYENGRLWLSSYEEILLFLDHVGLKIFTTEKELLYFGQELPEYLRQGQAVTAIGATTALTALCYLFNLFVSFFTYKYRAGVKWTMLTVTLIAACGILATALLVYFNFGWPYLGYSFSLQAAAVLLQMLVLSAVYRKRKKKQQ